MKLSNSYDGSNAPFQGDTTSLLKSIPANAQIVRATALVSPVDTTRGSDPFGETIAFERTGGDWGATKTVVPGGWVEVDFHGRRTLSSVRGSNLTNTTLQVDLGGAYIEVNDKGAFKAASDTAFQLKSDSSALPSLNVTKLKLTKPPAAASDPDIAEVSIRSAPNNVSLRLGLSPPFFIHLGDMTAPETTPDFAAVLQAFLADAQLENGLYVVPLVLHSDTIARLTVKLQIDYLIQQTALPPGVNDVTLPFDFSGPPQAEPDVLKIVVPANSRIAPGGTTARVTGAFEETRIVHNPLEFATPTGTVNISSALSHAQEISLDSDVAATAIDLLLGVTETARLQLDLRNDFDGKPDNTSLLPEPVQFEMPGPVGGSLERGAAPSFKWISVPLPTEVRFQSKTKVKRYWLVLQSLEGEADWNVAPTTTDGALEVQRTQDGGLSWRQTTVAGLTGTVAAFFRLRRKPDRFQMPIEMQVGTDDKVLRVSLDRFAPMGRVDFMLDFDEVTDALNNHLASTNGSGCPETEHLANGDFEKWLVAGDKIGTPRFINTNNDRGEEATIAFTPDGKLAYFGDDDALRLVEVACDRFLPDAVQIKGRPQTIIVHPNNTRAYINSGSLSVLDTAKLKLLPTPVNSEATINRIALSSDGRTLYAMESDAIWAISTEEFEQSVLTGKSTLENAILAEISLQEGDTHTAMAVSPDGRQVYVALTVFDTIDGNVRIYDVTHPASTPDSIPVARNPQALALTPDGKLAVVTHGTENKISIIDTASKTVAREVAVGVRPGAVIISPDGSRAFVANVEDQTISVIDLAQQGVVETIRTMEGVAALAITPKGDKIYAASTRVNKLMSIPIGVRWPAEWELTSGSVTHLCLPQPRHLSAILGSVRQGPDLKATAISQVAPVAESCSYEFSFWGIASEPDAVAEIFWLGHDCGLLRTDRIPVEAVKRTDTATSQAVITDTTSVFLASVAEGRPALTLHRVRLTSPSGADQAEVRFSVPEGIVAVVTSVSLAGTTEAVSNADFSSVQDGELVGWTISPAKSPGVALLATDHGIRIRNADAETSELVQTISVSGNQAFILAIEAQMVAQQSKETFPHLELRWFTADGTQAGEPLTLDFSAAGFNSSVAQGTSPEKAAQAEIHVVTPSNTTLDVKSISLRFSTATEVPLTFISQAPGELTVSDLRVAFEEVKPKAPKVPERGLCQPTQPGRQPGTGGSSAGFCLSCESEEELTDMKSVKTAAGRPAQLARCATCGTESVRLGGPHAVDAKPLSLSKTSFPKAVFQPQAITQEEKAEKTEIVTKKIEEEATATPPPVLTDINGIGEARAKQLSAIGIDSVAALAAAKPEDVMKVKGIMLKMATHLIERATELIASTKDDASD
jgi:YVTN family beta-propeller protein